MLSTLELLISGVELKELSQTEMTKGGMMITKLKTDDSPGPDGMHPRVLKELKYELWIS